MRHRQQVGDRYRSGALLANAVTSAVKAAHCGFDLDEYGARGSQLLQRSRAPCPMVDDREDFDLLPPEILKLVA